MSETTPLQSVTFALPLNYQIPELFLSSDPEVIATALTLGAEACRVLTQEAYAKVRNETHQEIIAEVKRTTEQEVGKLRREREEVDGVLQQATKRIRRLEQDFQEHEQRIRQEERRNREEIAKEKDARIQALEAQVKDSSKQLQTEFQQLREQMIRNTAGSTNKGKDGEAQVEELLKLSFGSAPSFDLNPVAKEGHKGDFIMDFAKAKFLWEVKNYSRMVNKDEVEKLHRDMRENPDIAMGIMVSLQTGIVGHTKAGDIDVEFIGPSGRCIVYISNLHQRPDKVFYLQSLRPLLEIMAQTASTQQTNTSEISQEAAELEALKSQATLVRNLLATHLTQSQRHYNSLSQHKKRSEQMFAELQSFVRESEGQVKEMIRVVIGTIDETLQSEVLENLSERTFKKTSALEMNEKERAFAQWLLSQAEQDEYGQIQIKDIVDKGKEAGFSEKEVRAYRETLFNELAWQKGGKSIVGLKWRD
jgi:hypothetical protein